MLPYQRRGRLFRHKKRTNLHFICSGKNRDQTKSHTTDLFDINVKVPQRPLRFDHGIVVRKSFFRALIFMTKFDIIATANTELPGTKKKEKLPKFCFPVEKGSNI